MDPLVFLLAFLTLVSTLIGGFTTIKFRSALPLFFSFAAGSLIAVAFLDILPEILNITNLISFPVRNVMITIVISFFAYSAINRTMVTHCIGDDCKSHHHLLGPVGAGSLVLHSFLDGVAIGTSFKISGSLGLLVALAVIFHDFTDGMNTVVLMLKGKESIKSAAWFLLADALAPVLGVAVISFLTIPESFLAIILSVFVGEFIYLGAAHLLPSTEKAPSLKVLASMALGIIIIAVVTSFL